MPDASQADADLLHSRHPEWENSKARWDFVRDHYDDVRLYDRLDDYMPRKSQGEHRDEYKERKKLAQYPNLLGPTLDSFTGLLFHKEDETERDWGALGDPEEDGTAASDLAQDADGMGTDHEALLKQLSTFLLLYQKAGVWVDTTRTTDEELTRDEARRRGVRPFWKLLPPQAIVNWRADDRGRVVEALILETADTRDTLADGAGDAEQERFLWVDLDGWVRLVEDGEAESGVQVVGTGTFDYTDGTGRPTLPLFVGRLPLARYPAHSLAKSNNAIFNGLSELRWSLRKGSFPYFIYSGSSTAFDEFLDRIKRGTVAIREDFQGEAGGNGHRWIAPGMDPAQMHLEVKEMLVTDFWRQAMYEFSDRSVERTATEINAEFISSIGAFLNLLAGSMDEAEGATLRLLEQAAGQTPGEAVVRRTRDYAVQDGMELARTLKQVLFGEMGEMPMPPELEAEGVKKVARHAGITTDDNREELEDAIERSAEIEADRQALLGDQLDAAAETEPETVGEARASGEAS